MFTWQFSAWCITRDSICSLEVPCKDVARMSPENNNHIKSWFTCIPCGKGEEERLSNCMTATLAHGQEYSSLQELLMRWGYSPKLTPSSTITLYTYEISCTEDNTTTNICKYLQDQCQINILTQTSLHSFCWIYCFKIYLNGSLNSDACDMFTICKD